MTYRESLAHFVLVTYNLPDIRINWSWLTGIVYAVEHDGQVILRMIDHNGVDSILNNNIGTTINNIRLYASKNGRYIGILIKENYQISKF